MRKSPFRTTDPKVDCNVTLPFLYVIQAASFAVVVSAAISAVVLVIGLAVVVVVAAGLSNKRIRLSLHAFP